MSKVEDSPAQLQNKIKNILLYEWDPIGIQAIPEAQDEYDGYISTVYTMLIRRQTVKELSYYLLWIEGDHMGLTVDETRTKTIAEKIHKLLNFG